MSVPPIFAHVPTPGDHYSPATGSAVMTIIHALAVCHAQRGGETRIIVSRGTRHDYTAGQCVEVAPTVPPTKWQKAADMAVGRAGLSRRFGVRPYLPASDALPADFDGSIFLHNAPPPVAFFKCRHPQARVCLWAHNRLFDTYSRGEMRRVFASADRVICVSGYLANEMRKSLGADAPNLRVVHNGIDLAQFHPADHPPETPEPVILYLGRVLLEKGPDVLVRAAVKLRDRPFRLRIIGSSNFSAQDPLTAYERSLRELAAPLGERVEFLPFVDRNRVADEYRRASIFCVPARWEEPFGLTTLEGMACGLPTIAARSGGITEVAGDAALLFPPGDSDALAEHLAVLLTDDRPRLDWAAKARSRAEMFAWSNTYEQLIKALE